MTIGEKIRKARKAAKMSQKDISARTGFAVNTISRYENGERIPNIEDIAKFSAALSVSVPDLLSEVDSVVVNLHEQAEREKHDIRSPINLRLYREQMLQAYEQLNAIGKKTAMERIIELSEIERYTAPDPPQD